MQPQLPIISCQDESVNLRCRACRRLRKVYLKLFTQSAVVCSEFCLFLSRRLSMHTVTRCSLPAGAVLCTVAALAAFAEEGTSGLASQLTRRYSECLMLSVVTEVAIQDRKLPRECSMHTRHVCSREQLLIASSYSHNSRYTAAFTQTNSARGDSTCRNWATRCRNVIAETKT